MGDTKVLDPETKKKLGDNQKKINMKRRMKGMVKGQVDSWRQDTLIQNQGSSVDWYLELGHLNWGQVKEKFLAQVGR